MTPARLALHEDFAVGLQLRARSNPGSFDATGGYATSAGAEHVLQQDVVAAARFAANGQAGILLPFLQTHRSAGGLDDWGGGMGDLSVTGRYDVLLAAETVHWPGLAVLAAVTLPTGRPPERASHALAADVTGNGSYDATVGLALEKTTPHLYGALNGWVTHRFDRSVGNLTQSFSTRWAAQVVGGYVFDSEAALGLYATVRNEGPSTIAGVTDPLTSTRLTTLGAAGVLPLRDLWRVQGSASFDVPLASFGKNEPAGFGLAGSLVRVWL